MKYLALLCLLLAFYAGNSQNVLIKRIELANEKIIVHYDLNDNNPNNEYQLGLYTSKDNFAVPMTKVKGDAGNELKPGAGKKIEWNIKEEFGDYDGELALEIRGKVFIMFAKIQDFDLDKKYKRGKTYPLNWKPGSNNPIHIELFKGSERMVGELNHPNNGSYSLTIPSNSKPGKDYRIRITDSKRPDEHIYTDFFNVQPKVPTAIKIAGGVVVLGGIAALAGGSSSGASKTADSNLPDSPSLPTN